MWLSLYWFYFCFLEQYTNMSFFFFNGNLVNNWRQVFFFPLVLSRLHSPTSSVFNMISRLLALQLVNDFPKIMVSWTENSLLTVIQSVLSTSKIWLPIMWTLLFILSKKVLRGTFFFLYLFFPLLCSCII